MFWYLSFLRPPPTEAPLSGTITLTPQISNDLRTEDFTRDDGPSEHDIFYTWTSHPPSELGSAGGTPRAPAGWRQTVTRPIKLTTWNANRSKYKPIEIKPPPFLSKDVRGEQRWSLQLIARSAHQDTRVPLDDDKLGIRPLLVSSMPIVFKANARGKGKQEMVQRVYAYTIKLALGVENVNVSEAEGERRITLTIREQTSFDLDKKVWDSGIGLSSWLVRFHNGQLDGAGVEDTHTSLFDDLRTRLFALGRRRVVELGAGTGIVSMTLASLRSSLSPVADDDADRSKEVDLGRIITTDLASAMPLLDDNIAFNAQVFGNIKPIAAVLDWDADALPEEVTELGGIDVILMADVTYNTTSFPALIRTLARLLAFATGTTTAPLSAPSPNTTAQPPLILLGYKQRDPAERSLWALARAVLGVHLERVGTVPGAGGDPVEVWIGAVSKSSDAAGSGHRHEHFDWSEEEVERRMEVMRSLSVGGA